MNRLMLLWISLISFSSLDAQTLRSFLDDPKAPQRERSLDFTHLRADLSFDCPAGLVKGRVVHHFTPLRPEVDSIFLDGILMDVSSLLLNGKPAPFHADSAGISIIPLTPLKWGEQDSIEIVYTATPRRGLYFIGWRDPLNLSRKQIWSQGEGIDNRYWIPMYDERNDKVISELNVTFERGYKVLSNGSLLSTVSNADGTDTWHYRMSHPHSPYLIMLGIGKYDIKETHAASGTPMKLYYYPEWQDRVGTTYQHSEAILDFLERETGVKYPWETYSQIPVQDYMFGAMENTTATIFGDFYQVDARGAQDRTYVSVNAHEAAHQWFGDYVTARSDAHQWLQESFATYYDQLFERSLYGEDHFDWLRRSAQTGAINESAHNHAGVGSSMAGGAQVYGKGAFVLNMLKFVVGGREAYNKAVKLYLERHPYRNVDSHDLLMAFEESTGMDLDWFWDEWIYRGEEPAYFVAMDIRPEETELLVQQRQELTDVKGYRKGLFKMPVPVEVHYSDQSVFSAVYWIERQTEIIRIPNPGKKAVAYVLFDPGNIVLKSLGFPKPFEMLRVQATEGEHLLDRYDALVAMRTQPAERKRQTLINIFHREKLFPLRAEVLSQLATDSSVMATSLFREATGDSDPNVRRAALTAAGTLTLPYCEPLLKDSAYGIVELALQRLSAAYPAKTSGYLKLTHGVEGNVGRNVLVRWLELSYLATGRAAFADQLVAMTKNSYEFRTRANAMAALKRSGYFSVSVISGLTDAAISSNNRLSGPALDLLRWYYAQNRYRPTIAEFVRSHSWTANDRVVLSEFAAN